MADAEEEEDSEDDMGLFLLNPVDIAEEVVPAPAAEPAIESGNIVPVA